MEDNLKRLLAAEQQAGEIIRQAEQQAEHIVQSAQAEAHTQQERFEARLPQLRAAHLDKAGDRARQTVKEIERRYAERLSHPRAAAELHEDEALDAAFAYLLNPSERTLS